MDALKLEKRLDCSTPIAYLKCRRGALEVTKSIYEISSKSAMVLRPLFESLILHEWLTMSADEPSVNRCLNIRGWHYHSPARCHPAMALVAPAVLAVVVAQPAAPQPLVAVVPVV